MAGERTKVVATLGPASSDPQVLGAMIDAGLDIVRLNFSHGVTADHLARFRAVREIAAAHDRNLAILADLQGPKIRVGIVDEAGVSLPTGGEAVLVAGAERAEPPELPVVYEQLAADVQPGSRVLLDDGRIELTVEDVDGRRVRCRIRRGGLVRSRKGVNLPGVAVSAAALTDKDLADLGTAVEAGADYLALSFVRTAADVLAARRAVAERGGDVPVVAKLERQEALDALDDILDAADGVMVARGDLGVELAVEKVPPLQKDIIARANALAVPVITATQMLESMVSNPRPTRAEASDVANAIFDGTDAVMLSEETAVGAFPVEAVATMSRIAREAERSPQLAHPPPPAGILDVTATVCRAAVAIADDLGARAVVTFTESGATARFVSRFRPRVPIIGLTPSEATRRRMALYWGVDAPEVLARGDQLAAMVAQADERICEGGLAEPDDVVVIVAGTPGRTGETNRVIVHRVGEPDLVQRPS